MNTPIPPQNKTQAGKSLPAALRLLVLLAVIGTILLLVFFTPLGDFVQDRQAIEELGRRARIGDFQAIACFVAVSSLMIMVGTPRLIFFTFGSFAFGFAPGLFYSLCGCLIGSFLAFSFARWGAREWLTECFGENRYIRRIVGAEPTILAIGLFRFLPISNALVNIGLALSHTGLRAFFIGSLLGYLPQGAIASLIGSGLAEDVPWTGSLQYGIAGVLLITLLIGTARLRRGRS